MEEGSSVPARRFRLLRYFSVASGVALLLMMALVAWSYYRGEVAGELRAAGERDRALAQALANAIPPGADSRRLQETLGAMARRLPLARITVYQPSGVAVYSSEPKDIGKDESANPAFRAARTGKAASELADRDIATYVPIFDEQGGALAVFELHSDAGDALARIRQETLRLALGLISLFAALYAALVLMVAHADRLLGRQQRELAENEKQMRAASLLVRKSEEAAEAASRAKTEFLSSVSRELRAPINALLGFGQQLLSERSEPLGESRRRAVEQILQSGRRLLELINELLDLARVESGKLVLSVEPVSVDGVLAECVPPVQDFARERGVRIDAPADGSLHVMADYMRLKQSLLHIVSNAVKYNRAGGSVSLRAEARDAAGRVRISVADTGPGIPAARHAEIFRPFRRLSPDAAGTEGTGIGLALARGYVSAMGGEIGFDSEPGRGATFWIELPPAKAPAPQEGARAAREAVAG